MKGLCEVAVRSAGSFISAHLRRLEIAEEAVLKSHIH